MANYTRVNRSPANFITGSTISDVFYINLFDDPWQSMGVTREVKVRRVTHGVFRDATTMNFTNRNIVNGAYVHSEE